MFYPQVNAQRTNRLVTEIFAGYNHNPRIADGASSSSRKVPLELFFTENLSTRQYPLLSPRKKRGTLTQTVPAYDNTKTYVVGDHCRHDNKTYKCTTAITVAEEWTAAHWTQVTAVPENLQAIIAKDALYWVDNGTLYANGYPTGLTGLQTQKETQLVSMGAYICVFPDGKYINTADLTDYGSMGASWSYTGTAKYRMCHQDGTLYSGTITKSTTEPADPANGDIWIDISGVAVAKEYSVYTEVWTVIETVYTRVDFTTDGQVPAVFKEYDGVQITGMYDPDLNGSKILYAVGTEDSSDFVVLVGIADQTVTESATISIERKIPEMDYVCEAQNRLWGCFYGNIPGKGNINEIYCCALGDFRNWEQYLGVSTDSWRGSRGSDGPFTGCINYLGTPTFFKENIIHPVGVSPIGAHQIDDIPARGVQQGCHKSLAVVNETLYYKSRSGVMAYQGGMPMDVGSALGEEKYYNAVAGVFGSRYYISMKDAVNVWHLFCFDAKTSLWMREDNLHVECFAAWGDELYAQSENKILALNGTEGELEARLDWIAESGIMLYSYPDQKYVSRYDLRVSMEPNAKMSLYIEYDSKGPWIFQGEMRAVRPTGSFVVPVKPRRCDHLRIRLEGTGEVQLYSIARNLEQGSDVV